MVAKLWWRLVRFGFRLLYYEMAWTYDAVSWLVSLGEWRRWQLAALPYLHGRFILEIGHGPGHMLRRLAERGYTGVGVDLSPHMGRQAQRRLRRAGVSPLLARANVQALPFAASQFDGVLSTFPTDYIIAPQTLTAVHRVLRANGRLVIVPEGHLTGRGGLKRLIDGLFRLTGQRSGAFAVDAAGDWPQASVWQPLQQHFAAAGFVTTIEQVQLRRSAVTIIIAEKSAPAE